MVNNDKISNTEYLFLVINHIMGYVLVLSFTDSAAKQDSWLVIIAAFFISVPFILIYAGLAKRFPSKTLLDVYQIVFGKVLGTIVSILYIGLFLVVFSYYLQDLSEFYISFFEPETPPVLFITVAVLAAAYGVIKGIQYLAKMSIVFAVLAIASIIITFFMLIGKMDFSNFLPVLRQPTKIYLKSISMFVMVPCCQTVYLLMLTPKLQSARELPRFLFWGLMIGIFFMLMISVRNTAVLGPLASIVDSASFGAIRMINIGNIITRVEFIVALATTALVFFNICILYYNAAQGLTQLFRLKSILWVVVPVGGIGVFLSLKMFNSSIEHVEFAMKYNIPIYSAFHFVFPPLALITAKLRKLKDMAAD